MSGLYLPLIPPARWKRQRSKASIKGKRKLTLAIRVANAWRWCVRHVTVTKPTPTITTATPTGAPAAKKGGE